jgi:hypothetical protein
MVPVRQAYVKIRDRDPIFVARATPTPSNMSVRLTLRLIGSTRHVKSVRSISDLVGKITSEHSEFRDQYQQITSATSLDEKRQWQNEFTMKVTIHALAEELVVFPAMEKYVEGGRELADRDRSETQQVCTLTSS